MRVFARTDSNQKEIVDGLRAIGATVHVTAQIGNGFPDFVCGYHGNIYLMEIKTEKGKLTKHEQEFFDNWTGGHLYVVRTLDDALKIVGAI